MFLFAVLCSGSFEAAAQKDSVTLNLKWWHQFQFAGYYAANMKGFYKAENLTINIIPGDQNHPPVQAVLKGNADFGVTGSDLILNYAKGQPVVSIGAIFQHSAYTIISSRKANINFPSDLIGKRIMASDDQGWVQLQALFLKEGIPLDSLKVIAHTWNNEDLMNGHADAMTGYISVEPDQLRQNGFQVATILPVSYGIDFYGDLLFTTQVMVQKHPRLTERFRKASFKGWEYAMAHPGEIADYILTLPGVKERNITKASLLFEAEEMKKLILPGLVEMGHQNEGRWQHILTTYQSLGLIDKKTDLDKFIYDAGKTESNRLWRILLFTSFIALLIVGIILFYNFSLHKAVKHRTFELEREVKERARMQEQLQLSEERLEMSIRAAGIGIWEWNIETGNIFLSDSIAQNLGYPPGSFPTDIESYKNMVHPNDLPTLMDEMTQQMEGTLEEINLSIRLKTKRNEWKWFLMISRVLKRDLQKNALCLSGIHLNIDELKNKEIELSNLSTTLLKRNNELQQFAYITSHNLRSPVANLISLSRLFKKEELGEHNSVYFTKIRECISNLNETLNDVNEILSLHSAGEEKTALIDLEQELSAVVTSISEMVVTTRTIITTEFTVPVLQYPKRILHSIFLNLLTNAIKYRRQEIPLYVKISSGEDEVNHILKIADNGMGIDLEKYGDKIFSLFQRFHSGVNGKGMGLYIIKNQIESLDGTIQVESAKNEGTVFTITIPKKEFHT